MHIGYGTLSLPPYLNVTGIYFDFVFGNDKELQSLLYAFSFTITIGIISDILFAKKNQEVTAMKHIGITPYIPSTFLIG